MSCRASSTRRTSRSPGPGRSPTPTAMPETRPDYADEAPAAMERDAPALPPISLEQFFAPAR